MKHKAAALLLTAAVAGHASAAVFPVVNSQDSGVGSLRWAIEQANATPGRDVITGSSSSAIQLSARLPAIVETVTMTLWMTIDGSGAGAADGLVLRASGSKIESIRVKNFGGDGIVIAGNDNEINYVDVANTRNGIVISGNNNSLMSGESVKNRQNGIWLTATASGNRIGHWMPMVMMCPPMPPMLISAQGNGAAGVRIDGTNNTIDGDLIDANGDGVLVTAAGNTISNTSLTNNTRNGATLMAPVAFTRNFGGCNAGSFVGGALVAPPAINVATSDVNAGTISGVFHGDPNRAYTLQLLSDVPSDSCPQGFLQLLGVKEITTDEKGDVAFTSAYEPPATAVAVIAVGADGQVSRLSSRAPVAAIGENRSDVSVAMTGPATAQPGEEVTYAIRLTNHGPAAINGAFVRIAATTGAIIVGSVGKSNVNFCYLNAGAVDCGIAPLAAGESATILHTVKVWMGTVTVNVTGRHSDTYRLVDPNHANDSVSASLSVGPPARRRSSGH